MTHDAFCAYLAGVADSDGSFSLVRSNKSRTVRSCTPTFQLTWTISPLSKKVMDRLVATYGGSYFEQLPTSSKYFKNSRPCYKYCLVAKKLEKFLKDILPYLQLKRKQVRNLLRIRRFTKHWGNGRNKPLKVQLFEQKMWALNKELNSKNGSLK
jgi:hypothetical protein